MVYKLVSCKQVISKVMADLDLDDKATRTSDMIEWCGEAMEKIGSVRQLRRRVSGVDGAEVLTLSGNQAKLPIDLFRLNRVAYSTNALGPWLPMTVSSSSFNVWSSTASTSVSDAVSEIDEDTLVWLVKQLYGKQLNKPTMTTAEALAILNGDTNIRTVLTNMIRSANSSSNSADYELKYSIKPGYVVTNISDGYIKLSYDAIPIDADGYPLVPDMMSYIEALYWYIVKKLFWGMLIRGTIKQELYDSSCRSWNFYCKQAYGDSMMPNEDEMESISNQWNKLIPELRSGDSFYSSVGSRQDLKNFNR